MKPSKLWYLAQGSVGVVQWVSVSLLLAPIIIQNTGSGGLMGMVIAIIGGFGISAPFIGKLADSYALHRPLQKIALMAHLLALVLLYFSGNGAFLYYVIGGLIGFGTVTLMLLNPTFVLSSSQNQQQEGKGLARLYQSQFVGVIFSRVVSGWTSVAWFHGAHSASRVDVAYWGHLSYFDYVPPRAGDAGGVRTSKSRNSSVYERILVSVLTCRVLLYVSLGKSTRNGSGTPRKAVCGSDIKQCDWHGGFRTALHCLA